MFNILIDIFESKLGSKLAFKGGTLAYFAYGLDRFSTDLDIDLIEECESDLLIDTISHILKKHGTIKDQANKKNTFFWLFSYQDGAVNIKIEINKRIRKNNNYKLINLYGTDMYSIDKASMFANKLVAVTDRPRLAHRDLYDIYYFFKQNWSINEKVITERTNKDLQTYLVYMKKYIQNNISPNNILNGLGGLLNQSKKDRVKDKLLTKLYGMIEFYIKEQ